MTSLSPQQVNKELSVYSFPDLETVVIRNILQGAGIKKVKNRLIADILKRSINEGVSFWFSMKGILPDLELLEKLYELNVAEEDRKVNGSYYTPTDVVSYIVKNTITDGVGSTCDPACGSGAFLVESAKFIKQKYNLSYSKIFEELLFGVDILP